MNCPNCLEPVTVESNFCESCGTRHTAAPPKLVTEITQVLTQTGSGLGCICLAENRELDADGFCQNCGKRIATVISADRAAECFETIVNERLALVSDVGRKHLYNEDFAALAELPEGGVMLIVADGVSTSWNAKIAAATAVKVGSEILKKTNINDEVKDIMKQAIKKAHAALLAMTSLSPDPEMDPPCATIVAAVLFGSKLVFGWVGDSRVYLINRTTEPAVERQLSVDDSWVEEVVAKGKMSREQALSNQQSHYITQTLGMRDSPIEIHIGETEVAENELLLLCTDGLWNYFPVPNSLAKTIKNYGTEANAATICRRLVARANEMGGRDNVTVTVRW